MKSVYFYLPFYQLSIRKTSIQIKRFSDLLCGASVYILSPLQALVTERQSDLNLILIKVSRFCISVILAACLIQFIVTTD